MNNTASSLGILNFKACWRRSGPASIRIEAPESVLSQALVRSRLFLLLADVQTAQVQAGSGTPVEVPQPSIVKIAFDFI